MPSEVQISDQQIIEAGESLKAEGKRISPYAIRNHLGGKGCSKRIKKVWNDYFSENLDKKSEESLDILLPNEIQETFDSSLETVTSLLKKLVQKNFHVATKTAEKRTEYSIAHFKEEIADFEEAEVQAEIALEQSDREKGDLLNKNESLNSKNEQLMQANASLSGQLSLSDKRIYELEVTAQKYNDLQREFGKLEGVIQIMQGAAN